MNTIRMLMTAVRSCVEVVYRVELKPLAFLLSRLTLEKPHSVNSE